MSALARPARMARVFAVFLLAAATALAAGCATLAPAPPVTNPPVAGPLVPIPYTGEPRLAVALGGGAARGFAHIGVLHALDEAGIETDIVVGTSAGAIVGALYAGGMRGDVLERAARELERRDIADVSLPLDRGIIGGERLQELVNRMVDNRPLQALNKTFVAVATDLRTGDRAAFTRGNTGLAVRASSAVPGVFRPVTIAGRDYVDGGLVSQVPVEIARELGADVVVAVDVSRLPTQSARVDSTLDVLYQAFLIMSKAVLQKDVEQADVLIRPDVSELSLIDFDRRAFAIAQGEQAARQALPRIRAAIERKTQSLRLPAAPGAGP